MIEVQDLRYLYPDGTAVLKGVNLSVADGEFLIICGPNGSGKTTLIRLVNGILKPSGGSIFVDGIDVVRNSKAAMQNVGMVFQDADSQIIGETVREDVAFGPENLGLRRTEVEERVGEALAMVGLNQLAEKSCHLLSGGEKRRLAIAGVLAMRPRIILFDEPFANLDYAGIRQVLQQIVSLHENGHTIIVTSHDVEKAVAHASRIVVLHEGQVKASGPPEEVIPELSAYGVRQPCCSLLGHKVASWLTD